MKRILLFLISAICILVAVPLWPAKHNIAPDDLPFDAYCPAFIGWMPSDAIKAQLQWKNLAAQFYTPPTIFGCFLKTLQERSDMDEINLYMTSVMYLTTGVPYFRSRYDLQAHFFQQALNNGDYMASDALAELYEKGIGVPKDTEKATHLFREKIAYLFPFSVTGDECVAEIEEKITPRLAEYEYTDLAKEQFEWLKALCHKDTDGLLGIAEWYMEEDNTYRSPKIAEEILYHLYRARGEGQLWPVYYKTSKESRRKN